MIAYKHIERQFYDDAVRRGRFLVSTLDRFRKLELQGSNIPDPLEGTAIGYANDVNIDVKTNNIEHQKMFESIGFDIKNNMQPGFKFISTGSVFKTRTPNYYIFCMSMDKKSSSMEREGKDSTIHISNVRALAAYLAECHPDKLGRWNCRPVRYRSIEYKFGQEIRNPDPFTKECRFSDQREIRICWEALATDEMFLTDCSKAVQLLS